MIDDRDNIVLTEELVDGQAVTCGIQAHIFWMELRAHIEELGRSRETGEGIMS